MVTIENACEMALQSCGCDFIKSVGENEKCYR